jgi:hypothetical protein
MDLRIREAFSRSDGLSRHQRAKGPKGVIPARVRIDTSSQLDRGNHRNVIRWLIR